MAYVSVDQLKRHIGISSTSDDVILAELIDEAQALIDAETGRTFEASADTTRYMDAVRDVQGALLWLDGDLCQITTVTNGDSVVVASNEYVTEPRRATPYYAIRLLDSSGKSWDYATDEENAIAVTGRWAFSLMPPADVRQACRDLAHIAYKQRDNLADTTRPLLSGDGNVIMPDQWPKSFHAVIKKYRRVVA